MAFRNPIVEGEDLVSSGLRSENYVEATSGWRIGKDGTAQFENLDVIYSLSANTMQATVGTFDTLQAGTYDVGGTLALLDVYGAPPYPLGIVGYQPPTLAGTGNTALGANTRNYMFGVGYREYPDRLYRVFVKCGLTATSGERWALKLHRVLSRRDASLVPANTTDSEQLYTAGLYNQDNTSITVDYEYLFATSSAAGLTDIGDNAGILFDFYRLTGSNNLVIANTPFMAYVEDMGPQPGTAYAVRNLNASSGYVYTGSPPSPPPVTPTRKTKTYNATWSRTFNLGSGATTWDDTASVYQGYYSSARGNNGGFYGLPYAAMQSDLTGATINSVTLKFKVDHTYYNAGAQLVLGTHTYTSKPGSISAGNYTEVGIGVSGAKYAAGGPYSLGIASSFITKIVNGTARGIMIGGSAYGSLSYYAYLEGVGQASPLQVVVDYTK